MGADLTVVFDSGVNSSFSKKTKRYKEKKFHTSCEITQAFFVYYICLHKTNEFIVHISTRKN